jgi:methionyl-tRNA synthetase
MASPKTFSITTTLPYVNAAPHIGFAWEILEADVLARFHRILGEEVVFNTGTDEHGINIYRKASELGEEPQAYVDRLSEKFRELAGLLNLSTTHFIRTTDKAHVEAAQEFWRRCERAGDIYKKNYRIKYCAGCELEKTESELDSHGRCLLHPNKEIEIIEEENYFFRWSKYQGQLLELYKNQPDFVVPEKRLNEIRNFVERGLEDFSISRLASKLPWGIPVPDDPEHVMYVWFDALVNYVATLGWPHEASFERFWPSLQIAGKDNLRQQAAMWQAMLASAGLPYSRQILLNGFINVEGEKMSKSLGNVVTPEELVSRFGTDGARYLLLSLATLGEDADFSWEGALEKYNAHLANGLGNLTSRVLKLASRLAPYEPPAPARMAPECQALLEEYRISEALQWIMSRVAEANKYIDEHKPWELAPEEPRFREIMQTLLDALSALAAALSPLLPETSEKLADALVRGETEPLFKRIEHA